jgi:hypothetical protein
LGRREEGGGMKEEGGERREEGGREDGTKAGRRVRKQNG